MPCECGVGFWFLGLPADRFPLLALELGIGCESVGVGVGFFSGAEELMQVIL